MLNKEEFRKHALDLVDWICDYYENIESYPVKSQVEPRDIFNKIPENANHNPEGFSEIMKDFQEIIMPGITHWQSPNFHAYFPANTSFESILAELLTSSLGAQCMVWATSPAAAELEEKMMNWLRDLCGLPKDWHGVIQDTASTATLVSLLTAREKATDFSINLSGFPIDKKYKIYCSEETHSSIEKAVKIAGFGAMNLEKIPVDENYSMKANELQKRIAIDKNTGKSPLAVVSNIGTTGCTAIDPIKEIGEICLRENLWHHVDAAYAGSALILDEYKDLREGLELADTYVFNPHKWLFTNFDCSAYFVKDKEALIRTFEIMPEYLKTGVDSKVNNYRDWGIALGRRFRALKLWFVIRSFGVHGLQEKLRHHLQLADYFAEELIKIDNAEIVFRGRFNLICFRINPNIEDVEKINEYNAKLLETLNSRGKVFLTHTKLSGKYVIRMVIAQTYVELHHVDKALEEIKLSIKLTNDMFDYSLD